MRSILLIALFLPTISGCYATWAKDKQAAYKLPPTQCEEAIDKAYDGRGSYYETATRRLDKGTLLEAKADCYWRTPDAREKHMEVARQWNKDHPSPSYDSKSSSIGVSTNSLLSIYAAGAAIGAASNRRGNTATSSRSSAAAATSTLASTQANQSASSSLRPVTTPSLSNSTNAEAGNQSSGTQTSAGSGPKTYRSASSCVRRDVKSNSLGDFWVNDCAFPVWVSWVDAGSCRQGCAAGPINPGKRESINKSQGTYTAVACEYPGRARASGGGRWTGGGDYKCADY